jgi:hypothetical protein
VFQVNIAQFHPVPGNGIVYGTKRGKVKVFYRNNFEAQEISTNNGVNATNKIDRRDGGGSRGKF